MYFLYYFINSLNKEIISFSFSSEEDAKKKVVGLCGELYKEVLIEDILKEDFIISDKVCFFLDNPKLVKSNFFLQRIYKKEQVKEKKGGQFFIKIFFERRIAYKE
ncbi:MAG: hypothetical protein WC839_00395 [Candidatus Paceibacterota bacterium]